jgi:hypothetical protein
VSWNDDFFPAMSETTAADEVCSVHDGGEFKDGRLQGKTRCSANRNSGSQVWVCTTYSPITRTRRKSNAVTGAIPSKAERSHPVDGSSRLAFNAAHCAHMSLAI